MWCTFYYAWIFFRWKIWSRIERTSVMKNSKYCSIFLLEDLTQQNIVPLKNCIVHKTFQVVILKCENWLSKKCFVKVKINHDIWLSETTFDNGVVKRWVAYFLKKLVTLNCARTHVVPNFLSCTVYDVAC